VTHVWPDPYNPKYAVEGYLKFDCMPSGSTVSIYTVSGELVQTAPEFNHMALWDGRNRFGRYVSSGIYFYAIQAGGQAAAHGKFLVVITD